MRIVKPSRYYLLILPIALLALAGLVWNRPKPVSAKGISTLTMFRVATSAQKTATTSRMQRSRVQVVDPRQH